jgi:NAD-dependent DNA ligase
VGKDAGSKYEKARSLGVKCVDEAAFRDMLSSVGALPGGILPS